MGREQAHALGHGRSLKAESIRCIGSRGTVGAHLAAGAAHSTAMLCRSCCNTQHAGFDASPFGSSTLFLFQIRTSPWARQSRKVGLRIYGMVRVPWSIKFCLSQIEFGQAFIVSQILAELVLNLSSPLLRYCTALTSYSDSLPSEPLTPPAILGGGSLSLDGCVDHLATSCSGGCIMELLSAPNATGLLGGMSSRPTSRETRAQCAGMELWTLRYQILSYRYQNSVISACPNSI